MPLFDYVIELERDRKILRWLEEASDQDLAECLKYREVNLPIDATLTDAVLAMMKKEAKGSPASEVANSDHPAHPPSDSA